MISTSHRGVAAALTGLALLGLAGCGTAHPPATAPEKVVVLPDMVTGDTLPSTTVTLHTGESFGVQHLVIALPKTWHQTSAGDHGVLARGTSVTVSPCPKGRVGCGTPTDDVYTARARGTTTVVWTYGPASACPASRGSVCDHVEKTIRVVVK